jgi:hypothetical protein
MKRKTLQLVAVVFLIAGINTLSAQTTQPEPINVVTTAVPFLRISPDARSGGMGDLGLATSPDANSVFWNLAKVPFAANKSGVGLTYTPWLKDLGLNDVYLMAASGYYQLDELSAIGASIRYFSLGDITFTDGLGNSLGEGRPRELGFDLGYTRKLSDRMGLGIALRYIHSNLVGNYADQNNTYQAGNAVAGDISFFYNSGRENGEGWNFGATLTNLGSKIGYTTDATQRDYIPANFSAGTAYTKVFDESNKITFGLDIHKLMVPTPPIDTDDDTQDSINIAEYRSQGVVSSWFTSWADAPGGFSEELREFQFAIGAEYAYNNLFFARAGYFYEDKLKGNRKYFTVGIGLKYNVIGLNFSYLVPSGSNNNRNPLSNTLRFGLLFDIDDSN